MTRLGGATAAALLAALTPLPASADPAGPPADGGPAVEVSVRPATPEPRGAFDLRATRAQLEASPRQQTAELLSAVPGFFVDHEDGEGLGNDVYLRGWDLDHGSGIELDVGGLPVNQPAHLLGQGYADLAFVIPEVVTGIHVRQGVSDPRQGDAAVVGSAGLELGVAERGLRADLSLGSFGQRRLLLVGAPRGEPTETFAAVALRETDGFGASRGARSGTANLQARLTPGPGLSLRVFGFGYAVGSEVPGVVREDDLRAGRVSLFGRYPAASAGQGAGATRLALGAELAAGPRRGTRVLLTPWVMATGLVARRNYSGAVETSRLDPRRSGLGDLFENRTEELAAGATARLRPERLALGGETTLDLEPGAVIRAGETDQRKRLLVPGTLEPWDVRTDAEVRTLDAALYADAVLERGPLRLAGGPRVDLLALAVDDALAAANPGGSGPGAGVGARRRALGVVVSPRLVAEVEAAPRLFVSAAYGEGFRTLDAANVADGSTEPYSKVRSGELGLRSESPGGRIRTSLALFETHLGNELTFVAEEGGFETQGPSVRRGVIGAVLARPSPSVLASTALSVSDSRFDTRVPGIAHRVPGVPSVLFRGDLNLRRRLGEIAGGSVVGRLGVGYTLLGPRPVTDRLALPTAHVVNLGASARRGALELRLDTYNALGTRYADSGEYYVSNLSTLPGQQLASATTHLTAAPPRTFLGTATLHL